MTFKNGDIYTGLFIDGKEDVYGQYNFTSDVRHRYLGQIKKGKFEGFGKMVAKWREYEGEFANGKANGFGTETWDIGHKYVGIFENGLSNGKGTFYFTPKSDYFKYEGDFRDDSLHGQGTLIKRDGSVYEGGWNLDRKHGFGKETYANKDFYEGYWKYDGRSGYGTFIFADGRSYVGNWEKGVEMEHFYMVQNRNP